MLNSVIMMGRVTDNIELRRTQNDRAVTSFSIAVQRSFAKQGTERQTDFFTVVAWGHQAEFASRYFTKGQLIAVQGRMETRKYEDKDGNKRTAYEIIAESLHFAESRRDTANNSTRIDEGSQISPSFSNADENEFSEIPEVDDDLPF